MAGFVNACCGLAGGGDCRRHFGKRTLGVDYGLRRVGLAVSVGFAPRLLGMLRTRGNLTALADEIADVAKREMVAQVVVGMPLNTRGAEGEQAKATRKFCSYLKLALPEPPIYLWDERYSTQSARCELVQAGRNEEEVAALLDSASAASILKDFFEQDGQQAEVINEGRGPVEYGSSLEQSESRPSPSYSEWRAAMIAKSNNADNPAGRKKNGKKKRKSK